MVREPAGSSGDAAMSICAHRRDGHKVAAAKGNYAIEIEPMVHALGCGPQLGPGIGCWRGRPTPSIDYDRLRNGHPEAVLLAGRWELFTAQRCAKGQCGCTGAAHVYCPCRAASAAAARTG